MKKSPFKHFQRFVMRTPLYPFDTLQNIDKEKDSVIFREALFIASPDFYERIESGRGDENDAKRDIAIYKYFSRACTRSTPFGLFAGCSTGVIGETTTIELEPPEKYRRVTRLDMQYLCALIQNIEKIAEIKHQLLYYPNDSIYEVAGKLRYVEYYYVKTHRKHQVAEVESSEYIERILERAKYGATIKDLSDAITIEDITYPEAEEFISELIEAHILKSELDPCVVGGDILGVLINKLSRLGERDILARLNEIDKKLKDIDRKDPGRSLKDYKGISDIIKTLGVDYDPKFLFQTDTFKPAAKAEVSRNVIDDIQEMLGITQSMRRQYRNPNLTAFANEFYERYEEQAIPLEIVLDNEIGLGYPYEENSEKNLTPLIDDLILPHKGREIKTIPFDTLDSILLRKYVECIKEGSNILLLNESDFKAGKNDSDRGIGEVPDTLAVMVRLIKDNGGQREIYMPFVNGISATALLGRFYHLDESIKEAVDSIVKKEQEIHQEEIIAEISHLPESRIGNIASRPLFRDYVIHYLSNSDAPEGCRIPLSDLMMSVRNGKIELTSKRYGKKILPKLSCAHNHSMSPIPLYRFLCDMESQQMSTILQFNYGEIFSHFDYTPRLQYKNIILSREKWRIRNDDIEDSYSLSDKELLSYFKRLSTKLKMPRYLVIGDGDNELFVDTESAISIRTMLSHIKNRNSFSFEEFLFDYKEPPVQANGNGLTNEMIFFFHK